MTREERVLATIARRPVDYLPCHIYFAAMEAVVDARGGS